MGWVLSSFAGWSSLIYSGDHSPGGWKDSFTLGDFLQECKFCGPLKAKQLMPLLTNLCAPDVLCTVPLIHTMVFQ